MMMIPIPHDGILDLLVILEDENLERIKQHDNAEVNLQQLQMLNGIHLQKSKPRFVWIAYANPAEVARLHELRSQGRIEEALKLLTGGFKFRPDLGDHDKGPQRLPQKPHQ